MSKYLRQLIEKGVSEKQKNGSNIPYNTNGKWSFFEARIENGLRKHQKSITFIDKSYRIFYTFQNARNRYKTKGKSTFSKRKIRLQNTL